MATNTQLLTATEHTPQMTEINTCYQYWCIAWDSRHTRSQTRRTDRNSDNRVAGPCRKTTLTN